ncbi:MAG: PAS domain-containing protein [Deltaproteobacteria bacterium]|nr:PAS domain-containing protein [Deltaproteobacteria bacterium]
MPVSSNAARKITDAKGNTRAAKTSGAGKQAALGGENLFYHSPHPCLVVEADTLKIVEANQAFFALSGLKPKDCIGRSFLALSLWLEPDQCKKVLEKAKAGKPAQNIQISMQNGKGDKEMLLSASMVPAENWLVCSLTDVTALVDGRKESDLEIKARELTETNEALRLLLNQRREDVKRLEQRIVANVEDLVLPYLQRMRETPLDMDQRVYLSVVESNLTELVSPFMRQLGTRHANLTPREIEVANLVRMGTTSKEIARLLKISKRAVEFHRDSLRNKLGLKKTKQNLRAYLSSLS